MPPNDLSSATTSTDPSIKSQSESQPKSGNGNGNGNQIKRLASKPLKLAASTFRPLTRSSSSSTSAIAPSSSSTSSDAPTYPSETSNTTSSGRGLNVKKRIRHGHIRSKEAAATLTPSQLASAARGPRKPLDGEEPAAWLRVRVVKADNLVAKDRNGTSDP